ncbi:MAG: phosphoglycerate dehydrogenase [Spirochaetota bacterium]
MTQIYISTHPFASYDPAPLNLLQNPNWHITQNPFERKLKPEELLEFAKDAEVLIASTENLQPFIESNPKLQMIARVGIGLDSVPLRLCQEKGIRVTYTPDAVTKAVAELTIAFMISLTRNTHRSDNDIRHQRWKRYVGKRLGDSTIGILGFGRVGSNVARLLSAFSPKKILYNDIQDKQALAEAMQRQTGIPIHSSSKEEIFSCCDIISLHLPHTQQTDKLINKNTLALFSPHAVLINTARGNIIDEAALLQSLQQKRFLGAALDVFVEEPYRGRLSSLDNVLLTAHIGSCSFDCRYQMEYQAAEDVVNFLSGKPLLREVPEIEYFYQDSTPNSNR